MKLINDQAYIHGLLSDYLIPKIYLFDILLLANVLIIIFQNIKNIKNIRKWIKNNVKLNKIDIPILFFIIIILTYQLIVSPLANFFIIFRLTGIIVFAYQIFSHEKWQKHFYRALIISLAWQSFLAYYQFFNQKALAPYQWFGESNLQSFTGISHGSFLHQEKILPYGSTAHPNILAGLVLIFSIILIESNRFREEWEKLLLFNAFLIALLTQSVSSLLSLSLFFIFLIIKKAEKNQKKWQKNIFQVFCLLFFIFSPFLISRGQKWSQKDYLSLSRRHNLNVAALKMWQKKPILGWGQQQFVRQLENFTPNKELVRFVQPVHHLGLLVLSEGGLILIILLAMLIIRERKSYQWSKILILIPLASLDHYLLSQTAGLASLILLIFTARWSQRRR